MKKRVWKFEEVVVVVVVVVGIGETFCGWVCGLVSGGCEWVGVFCWYVLVEGDCFVRRDGRAERPASRVEDPVSGWLWVDNVVIFIFIFYSSCCLIWGTSPCSQSVVQCCPVGWIRLEAAS